MCGSRVTLKSPSRLRNRPFWSFVHIPVGGSPPPLFLFLSVASFCLCLSDSVSCCMSVVSGVVWTVCRVWCDVCCVGGRKGRRGKQPSLAKKHTRPPPKNDVRACWTFQRFSVIHSAPRHLLELSCYCGTNMAAGFIQQRFFGGGRIGSFLGPIHVTDTLATRNVVSTLRQKHSLRLGHPLHRCHFYAPRIRQSSDSL